MRFKAVPCVTRCVPLLPRTHMRGGAPPADAPRPRRSYGGMYVTGLAYRGTANNTAVQRLLHFAVADVSDDVRRAAVLCLGFVLMGAPEQCPRIVALLAESYNPHLRYGARPRDRVG